MRHTAFLWLASAARAGKLLGKVAAHGAARRRRREVAFGIERWSLAARQRRAWRPVKVRALVPRALPGSLGPVKLWRAMQWQCCVGDPPL